MSRPIRGRDEVIAAIDGLVERVAHLARNVERVRPAPGRKRNAPSKMEGQLELVFDGIVPTPACKAVAVDIDEAAIFPLSPEQNGATVNIGPDATGGEPRAKIEAAPIELKNNGCKAENGVASHVLILHDRLGGFMKPPIPTMPADDQNT